MAPRANWKGYLRLSLVSCPILLYPATSDAEKVRFNQINKKTGNRIKMQKVDAETGDVVDSDKIVKGYNAGDGYIEITEEDLDAIEVESTRTINVDQFVPRAEIDDLYIDRPYYIVPDGEVGRQAFGVIRDAIAKKGMVAIGRVVLSSREHIIALEARDKGILGMLLHYPYEVRKPKEYFGDIPDEKAPKEMIDLAVHIIDTMAGHFDPEKFDDRYEDALRDLIKRKAAGEKIAPVQHAKPKTTVNLLDALRASLEGTHKRPPAESLRRRAGDGVRTPAARPKPRRKAAS
jgi:DNA end-binding protein Ku